MNLAENIYTYRKKSGMSQGDLAEALDVSRQSVSKWETGTAVPELDKLVRMSQLFDVTLDELVGTSPPKAVKVQESSAPLPEAVSSPKILGTILLACAIFTFLIFTWSAGLSSGLAWAFPLLLCGLICLLVEKHKGLWCGWALYLALAYALDPTYHRMNYIFLIHLAIQIILYICTLRTFWNLPLELTKKCKAFLYIGGVLFILYWIEANGIGTWPEAQLVDFYELKYFLDQAVFVLFTALSSALQRLWKTRKERTE